MEDVKIQYPDDQVIVCTDLNNSEQRSLVFQLLYAAESLDYSVSLENIIDSFKQFDIEIPIDSQVFKQTSEILNEKKQLDELVIPLLANWRVERLGVCTRLILRLATWELYKKEIDSAIIINEAIELAKCFAEKDAYKFVNGILDELIKRENFTSESNLLKT